jgi:hypothetical protein
METVMVGFGVAMLLGSGFMFYVGRSLEGGGELFAMADLIPKLAAVALLVIGIGCILAGVR